jgi:hypothetical protein
MKFFRLADIIGQEIAEVRTRYVPPGNGEYSIPLLNTYIKLNNNIIIGIPNCYNDDLIWMKPEDQERLQKLFELIDPINEEDQKIVTGQRIIDMLFCYEEEEPAYEYSAYFKLSNGYYLTERNYEMVAFRLLDEHRFLHEKAELARRLNIVIRSFFR